MNTPTAVNAIVEAEGSRIERRAARRRREVLEAVTQVIGECPEPRIRSSTEGDGVPQQ